MATQIPLNTFKLIAKPLTSGSNEMYKETVKNVSSIIISSQIANLTNSDQALTVKLNKSGSIDYITLVKDVIIPPSESLNPFTGKIILEKGDGLYFYAPSGSSILDATVSILENAND
jgi:hypothetical protein